MNFTIYNWLHDIKSILQTNRRILMSYFLQFEIIFEEFLIEERINFGLSSFLKPIISKLLYWMHICFGRIWNIEKWLLPLTRGFWGFFSKDVTHLILLTWRSLKFKLMWRLSINGSGNDCWSWIWFSDKSE